MNLIKTKLIYYYLQNENNNKGFGLIHIFAILAILGIVFTIALPPFLRSCGCTAESRAEMRAPQNIYYANRMQAFSLTEGAFLTDFDSLGLGNIKGGSIDSKSSKYYTYIITKVTNDYALIEAHSKNKALKSYAGAVFKSDNSVITKSIVCQAEVAGKNVDSTAIIFENGELKCPEGSLKL